MKRIETAETTSERLALILCAWDDASADVGAMIEYTFAHMTPTEAMVATGMKTKDNVYRWED